jgi:hypothetical protein
MDSYVKDVVKKTLPRSWTTDVKEKLFASVGGEKKADNPLEFMDALQIDNDIWKIVNFKVKKIIHSIPNDVNALEFGEQGHSLIAKCINGETIDNLKTDVHTYKPWLISQIKAVCSYVLQTFQNALFQTEVRLSYKNLYIGNADLVCIQTKPLPAVGIEKVVIFDWKFTKVPQYDITFAMKSKNGSEYEITKLYNKHYHPTTRAIFYNNQWYSVLLQLNFYAWIYRKQNSYSGNLEIWYGNFNDEGRPFLHRMPLFHEEFFSFVLENLFK